MQPWPPRPLVICIAFSMHAPGRARASLSLSLSLSIYLSLSVCVSLVGRFISDSDRAGETKERRKDGRMEEKKRMPQKSLFQTPPPRRAAALRGSLGFIAVINKIGRKKLSPNGWVSLKVTF